MKSMVIGISPNYNYPGTFDKWNSNNTYFASNLGASLIVRSLMKEFDAEYVDDFSDIKSLRSRFDTCFLGLATHAHARRDISYLVEVLNKLDMKVVVASLGVSDYLDNTSSFYRLHPSVIRLLEIASAGTQWIGVRGPYTAAILHQNGFNNVVPIGCPTLYSNLHPEFKINIKETYTNPLVTYHRTLAGTAYHLIKDLPLLGQDYEDEAFFTDRLPNDTKLHNLLNSYYRSLPGYEDIIQQTKKHGVFTPIYEDWFAKIAKHDFVFGPRLHGCIASLLQGTPAVLTPRDLRVREIVNFFDLPNIPYSDLKNYKLEDIYVKADFHKFQNTYKLRYNNFLSFIHENNLESKLKETGNHTFTYTNSDFQTFNYITYSQIKNLSTNYDKLVNKIRVFRPSFYIREFKRLLKKLFYRV